MNHFAVWFPGKPISITGNAKTFNHSALIECLITPSLSKVAGLSLLRVLNY